MKREEEESRKKAQCVLRPGGRNELYMSGSQSKLEAQIIWWGWGSRRGRREGSRERERERKE